VGRGSVGQGIPEAGESESGEVGFVAGGEFGHVMMPQGEGESGIEDDAGGLSE